MKRKNRFATSIKLNSCAYIVRTLTSETFRALQALSDKGLYRRSYIISGLIRC